MLAGKALETIPRDQVVIASKFGAMKVNGVYQFDSSPEGCRKSLEGSLKNLGTDYIDLFILRSWDHKTPIEDTIKAMAVSISTHVQAGIAAVSHFAPAVTAASRSDVPIQFTG